MSTNVKNTVLYERQTKASQPTNDHNNFYVKIGKKNFKYAPSKTFIFYTHKNINASKDSDSQKVVICENSEHSTIKLNQ